MKHACTTTAEATGELTEAFAALRRELKLPPCEASGEFSTEVLAEAEQAAAAPGETVGTQALPSVDRTDEPFVTIDPPSARDLDQAVRFERLGSAVVIWYAIADLTPFVAPDGLVAAEAGRRAQTVYLPDGKVPLHPPVLSEGAASLNVGQPTPAYVWRLVIDDAGGLGDATVERAMVRSVGRFAYEQVQTELDGGPGTGAPSGTWELLREVGVRRAAAERRRGGASLQIPEQEVVAEPDGTYSLRLRPPLPAEDYNAQVSLATGMAAAELMLGHNVGILRTLPEPDRQEMKQFVRQARALGVQWPDGASYGELLRSLDPRRSEHLAVMYESRRLFRGAGYTPLLGEKQPEVVTQAAVGAPYAHTTAPIRRLVDRFSLATCEAVVQGRPVPEWVVAAVGDLPETMREAGRRAGTADRRATDIAEAAALARYVGSDVDAVVVGDRGGDQRGRPPQVLVQVRTVPVVAWCDGQADLGDEVPVTVAGVDIAAGAVSLALRTS